MDEALAALLGSMGPVVDAPKTKKRSKKRKKKEEKPLQIGDDYKLYQSAGHCSTSHLRGRKPVYIIRYGTSVHAYADKDQAERAAKKDERPVVKLLGQEIYLRLLQKQTLVTHGVLCGKIETLHNGRILVQLRILPRKRAVRLPTFTYTPDAIIAIRDATELQAHVSTLQTDEERLRHILDSYDIAASAKEVDALMMAMAQIWPNIIRPKNQILPSFGRVRNYKRTSKARHLFNPVRLVRRSERRKTYVACRNSR